MNQLEPIFGDDGARNGSNDGARNGSEFTRRDLARVLFKHKGTILTCFVATTAVVVAALLRLPATYASEAKVLINSEGEEAPSFFSGVAAMNDRPSIEPFNRRLETEMELLTTASVAEQAVRELGLTYDQVHHSALTHLIEPLVGLKEGVADRVFGIAPDKDRHGLHATVKELQKSIAVLPVRSKTAETSSSIIAVGVAAPDPEIARKTLGAVLNAYIGLESRLNEDAGRRAEEIVRTELAKAEQDVRLTERRLRDFLATNRFVPRSGPTEVASGSLGSPDRPPATAQGQPITDGTITTPRDEQSIARLKLRLVELEVELLNAQQVFRGNSDRVQMLQQSIAAIRERISRELDRDAWNSAQYNQFTREQHRAEARFSDLQRRIAEISLYVQVNRLEAGRRIVVEGPLAPDGSDWKRKVVIAILGATMGLLLGVSLAGLREYADHTLGSKDEVRRHLGIDVLAVIPAAREEQLGGAVSMNGTSGGPVRSPRGQQMLPVVRELAARVTAAALTRSPRKTAARGRSILVTSARAAEGKTFVATALAVQLAGLGYGKALLARATDRSSSDGNDPFGPRGMPTGSGTIGLRDLLANGEWPVADGRDDRAPEEAKGDNHKLTTLSLEDGLEPALLMSERRVTAFLAEATCRFDWVVLDGDMIGSGSITWLAQLVDATVLVVDAQRTRREVVQDAMTRLATDRQRVVGAVLNRRRHEIPQFFYERL